MNKIHKKINTNNQKVFLVGDIHGMYDEFVQLLNVMQWKNGDILISTGDLIDRGPQIKETLDFFMKTDNTYVVCGNHENKFLKYLSGKTKNTHSLRHTIEQTKPLNQQKLREFIESLPRLLEFDTNKFVFHAGIHPFQDVRHQKDEDNYIYMREFTNKKNDVGMWWDFYYGSDELYFGHEVTEPEDREPFENCFSLDGGACFGKEMRGIVIAADGRKTWHAVKSNRAFAKYNKKYIEEE